ncbi:MAG: cytochrome c [Rhodothermales bacterium]
MLLLVSCESRPPDGDATTAAPVDTTGLQRAYAVMDSLHADMMAQYRLMEDDVPDVARQMYGSLQAMHRSAAEMHGGMMGGAGMGHGMSGDMNGGMMGGGMMGGAMMDMHRAREWDRQMAAMHAQMSAYMRGQGYEEMAELHDEMAVRFHGTSEALPRDGSGDVQSDAEPAAGAEIYGKECATCHGSDGEGVQGVFPPLAGSEWVTGDSAVPVKILLLGLAGDIEVRGEAYRGTMPAFGARMSDAEIAAVTSFVRSSWDNEAGRIAKEDVRQIREEFASRSGPWEGDELQ